MLAVSTANGQFLLTSSSPDRNSRGILVNSNVVLEFNQSIDASTASGGISVRSNLRYSVPGTINVSGSRLTFDPATPLLFGEEITVTMLATLKSMSSESLSVPSMLKFVTEIGPSPSNPAVFNDILVYNQAPHSMKETVAADMDNDGDIDLLFGGNANKGWLENNGAEVFTSHIIDETNGFLYEMRPIDIDNDADLDVIVATISGGVQLLINDGTQQFTSSMLTSGDTQCTSLDVADFNSDGRPDIVFADTYSENKKTYILYNNGGNTFIQTEISNTSAYKTRVSDIDSDGDWDIVQEFQSGLQCLVNQDVSFSAVTLSTDQVTFGTNLAIDDLDGDNDVDIAVIKDNGVLTLYTNNGTFPFTPSIITTDTYHGMLTGADFDGDDDIDLIISSYSEFVMMENDGIGNFAERKIVSMYDPGISFSPHSIGSADVDGDGDMDFYSLTQYYKIAWFENVTMGEAFPFTASTLSGVLPLDLADGDWGDFDNDGDLDLVMSGIVQNLGQHRTIVYENQGGQFVEKNTGITNLYLGSCDWGDYDLDGDLDLLLMGASKQDFSRRDPLTVIYTNQNGVFTLLPSSLTELPKSYHGEARWADFNNDGWLDIAMLSMEGSAVFQSNGQGHFIRRFNLPSVFTHGNLDVADYDNDGDNDLAVSGWRGNDELGMLMRVYRNDGDFVFAEAPGNFTGIGGGNLQWADMDNDGDFDLVAAGAKRLSGGAGNIPSLTIYENQSGTFKAFVNSETIYDPGTGGSMAAGDYNNDGVIDVATTTETNYSGDNNHVYKNNGALNLTDIKGELPVVASRNASWVDYDRDNDLDIFLGSKVFTNNTSFKNTRPLAPTHLEDSVFNNTIYIYWDGASDAETSAAGLAYQVYAGTASQKQDILNANASSSNGLRKLIEPGLGKGKFRKVVPSAHGTVYYGVQSIDAAFEGSVFSNEKQTFFIKLEGVDKACLDFEYTYSAKPIANYTWQIVGGTILSGQGTDKIIVKWNARGTGYIKISNAGGSKNTLRVSIEKKPLPSVDGPTTVCTGFAQYNVTDSLSYQPTWSVSGGSVTAGQGTKEATINWATAGTNKVTLEVLSKNKGCVIRTIADVFVDKKPTPAITGNDKVCATRDNAYQTLAEKTEWNVSGGLVRQQTPSSINVTWQAIEGNGLIGLKEFSERNYCFTATSLPVRIYPLPPKPEIEIIGDKLRSTLAPAYQWYYNDSPIAANEGGTNRDISMTQAGRYKVEITSLVKCTNQSDEVLFTSTEEVPGFSKMAVFPNPANDNIAILLPADVDRRFIVRITTVSGTLLKQIDVENSHDPSLNLDVSNLNPGYYVLTLKTAKAMYFKSFVKR